MVVETIDEPTDEPAFQSDATALSFQLLKRHKARKKLADRIF